MQIHNFIFNSFFYKCSIYAFFILFGNHIMEIFSYQYIENFLILSFVKYCLHGLLHFIYIVLYCSLHSSLVRMKIAPHSSIVLLLIIKDGAVVKNLPVSVGSARDTGLILDWENPLE